MKMDQIAFYAHDDNEAATIKKLLGLKHEPWIEDYVTGYVRLGLGPRPWLPSQAHLQFNYTLGTEVEILTYLDENNWHRLFTQEYLESSSSFLSHIGCHLEPGEEFPTMPAAPLVQEMKTTSHTNPYVIERGRHYHYRIHDARAVLGTYIKYIRRIDP